MKTTVLLLSAAVAAFSFTAFAAEAPISARAAANQTRVVGSSTETPVVTIAYVAAPTPVSARAAANQSKILKGTGEADSTLACTRMSGGPKAIKACVEHPGTMPGCNPVTVAPLK